MVAIGRHAAGGRPGLSLPRGATGMKTFTLSVDTRIDEVLEDLKVALGKPSRAEVVRLAVALLNLAVDARRRGLKLVLTDGDEIGREIPLP
jgi:hypothetical protein